VAGQIQSSFLPDALPEVDGWQLVATLVPARETSGDFYDVIPLGDGRLGILVADVADKGMGAALYMALCHTLIRTYAAEPNARPDRAFGATNRRILMDARAGLFVTAFYGALDPSTGVLTYCNAGHSPPYLLRAGGGAEMEVLHRTGMALGVIEDETWTQATVQLHPGDVLLDPLVQLDDLCSGHIDDVPRFEGYHRRWLPFQDLLEVQCPSFEFSVMFADDDHVAQLGRGHVEPADLHDRFEGRQPSRHGDQAGRLDFPAHIDPPVVQRTDDDRHLRSS